MALLQPLSFADSQLKDLRADLVQAEYRATTVRALLGQAADEARLRGVSEPAVIMLEQREESALAVMIRLFLLGEALSATQLDASFPRLGSAGLAELGICQAISGQFTAALSLNPVELPGPSANNETATHDWLVLSDLDDQLRNGPARADHVMGVGGATRSLLAQLPLGDNNGMPQRALDLGTGCGIVALSLARAGVTEVVATDISARAIEMARANALLNEIDIVIDFRLGDLFSPVAQERFDLIASNPPFVITPRSEDATTARYEYRDAGFVGDDLARRVVAEAPQFLSDGGTLVCLANWESHWGKQGLHRVSEWISAAQLDSAPLAAWVIERDRLAPEQYAETWIRDGGVRAGDPEFSTLMRAWLGDFAARRVTAIGLGSIKLQRLSDSQQQRYFMREQSGEPLLRTEYAPEAFATVGLGATLDRVFQTAVSASLMTDAQLLAHTWYCADTVTETREHRPGQEAPFSIQLHSTQPLARVVHADPLLAAAVGACDGDLTLHQIAQALAQILELDADACAEALVTGVRELIWLGILEATPR